MDIHPSHHQPYYSSTPGTNGASLIARDNPIKTSIEAETGTETDSNTSDQAKSTNTQQKSPEEEQQIKELRTTDQEVRAHEMAHLAAAGGLSKGGATFEYQHGPDGQLYAVSGEVQIDSSGVSGDPEATLQRAQQIQRAALAPAQPSSQDRSVAVAAAAMAAEARAEIANQGESNNKRANHNPEESNFQRNASKVNDAYNANTEIDSQRAVSLIDLTV